MVPSLAATENHRCPNDSIVAAVCEFGYEGPARNAPVSCFNTPLCLNKSLVQALESCHSSDITPPAVLPTLVPSLVKSAGLGNAYTDSQNLDATNDEPTTPPITTQLQISSQIPEHYAALSTAAPDEGGPMNTPDKRA